MIYRIVTKLKDRNNFDLAIAWLRFTDVAYNALGPLGGVVLELIRQKLIILIIFCGNNWKNSISDISRFGNDL